MPWPSSSTVQEFRERLTVILIEVAAASKEFWVSSEMQSMRERIFMDDRS